MKNYENESIRYFCKNPGTKGRKGYLWCSLRGKPRPGGLDSQIRENRADLDTK